MKSVMTHRFSEVPNVDLPRSQFNRSHGIKTTFDADYLYPILVDEALPGDSINLKMAAFMRMTTPITPVMDNMYVDTLFFAVPKRILWENWEKFNGAQDNPADSIDFTIPMMNSGAGYADLSLADYMGIRPGIANLEHSALFFRAYAEIWNAWFRDQNLQDSVTVSYADGPDTTTSKVLLKRGKRHDYFTSCLPWPQKGGSEVTLPLGVSAPVKGIGVLQGATWFANQTAYEAAETLPKNYAQGTYTLVAEEETGNNPYPTIHADLSNATAATINELRQAFQIQKLLERDARGGTRYVEILHSHFGVTSPDFRLQRPEYLGGGSSPINVTPVAQTSETGTTPQGNLAAMATASATNHGFVKSFTEHCIIIGLVNVRADLTYQHGLNRMWSRETRYDFYWPTLAMIGEQAVLNKEIFVQATAADDEPFGYQGRYDEYRYKQSMITGKFRSDATGTLHKWHLSEDFNTLPVLGPTFIEPNTPMSRVLAVAGEPQFIFDGYFRMLHARPMPVYGTPGFIDHF